ncbi:sporulation protein YunB [Clostridium sp. SM-530-WT-3G]|uniref:sporulation protein YunB n=1 Tax=Clostridium sp. SM-530-WT-3G TaxID=2725303 RepID=UPI00145F17F1|nr:sporulation protein YunB [Clostridium sp. SM-530-WT-3G]NME83063.1 sporulation protein YunB [Clostridium sp. SM-530-WT-3G]
MEYYTKRKSHKYLIFILVIIVIFFIFNIILIFFDRKVMPAVIKIAEIMANSQTLNIINEESIKILNDDFKYDEMVKIEKDSEGNIILIQADTSKLNNIAAELSTNCNNAFKDMDNATIKVPLGWMSDRSIFYNLGPSIKVNIQPVGNIATSYESKFESAGINQTRHKVYLNISAKVRLKLPMNNDDIDVTTQIPVSDTIIVGKIPNTTIGFGEK